MKIPRGVQQIEVPVKSGQFIIKYRVQIKRKDFKRDKTFDTLEQAVEFLNASRSITGRTKIELIEERAKDVEQYFSQYLKNPPLSTYIKNYIERYIEPKFSKYDPKTDEGKIKLRNYKSILSFYETIKSTEIDIKENNEYGISNMLFYHTKRGIKFGDMNPKDIDAETINQYIIKRLETIKPISVQRELTHISNVFSKIKYFDRDLKDLKNPVRDYDKDLLKIYGNITIKKPYRITTEQMNILRKGLETYQNQDMKNIIYLMLLTAMRRSEAVLLKWTQISENHIYLTYTKSNRPRTIYLTKEAKEFISNIPRKPNQDRLFNYSVLGFDGSYQKFISSIGLDIPINAYRKEAISNFVERIGAENSILIAEILGISNIRKLEDTIAQTPNEITNQRDLLKSIGHTSSNITHGHYFSFKK